MEFDVFQEEFEQKIFDFAMRLDVNYIVASSTVYNDVINAKLKADEFLKSNDYNKIAVDEVIILNDKKKIATQQIENNDLSEELKKLVRYLDIEVEKFANEAAFGYDMNAQFKDIIRFVDLKKDEMNYEAWLKLNDTKKEDSYFLVKLDNDWYTYKSSLIQLLPQCDDLIDRGFKFRKHLLQYLKNGIVNIFSRHLFLPDMRELPKIKYKGSSTNVCELILAITESRYFDEDEKFNPIMKKMFGITDKQYTDARGEINKRTTNRGLFLTKMLESFNKKPNKKSK